MMHLNYITKFCPLCGRGISQPNIRKHYEACLKKKEAQEGIAKQEKPPTEGT